MRIKPKKRLGQNFLTDKNIQRKIIASLALEPSDVILEIGAGTGVLTGLIASRAKKVYAIEIDPGLCAVLQNNLSYSGTHNLIAPLEKKNRQLSNVSPELPYSNVKVINEDILKFDLVKHIRKSAVKLKVVGNIPYYISSPIIEYLFKYKDIISEIFLTLQKEFAVRLCALSGSKDYGAFSCFMQYYSEPKVIFEIKKSCFFPVPKVDSSFVKLAMRMQPPVIPKNEELLFKIIRAAFNQRRKVLKNSLEGLIKKERLQDFFVKYSVNINTRPEELSLEDFSRLTFFI